MRLKAGSSQGNAPGIIRRSLADAPWWAQILETYEATGDDFALAKAVFSALSMPDSAEKCARAAVRSQGTSAH